MLVQVPTMTMQFQMRSATARRQALESNIQYSNNQQIALQQDAYHSLASHQSGWSSTAQCPWKKKLLSQKQKESKNAAEKLNHKMSHLKILMSSFFTKLMATPLRPNLPDRPILRRTQRYILGKQLGVGLLKKQIHQFMVPPVDVELTVVGKVIVDHQGDLLHVNSTRPHVCCDQHPAPHNQG